MSIDLRFMSPLPFPGLLFHIYHQAGFDEEELSSHLPLVRHIKEFQRRSDTLDTSVTKYSKKAAELVEGLKLDAEHEDDAEAKRLTAKVVNINGMIHDYLEGLLPILREQKESAKQLDNYLCPPTVELFHKKAEALLKNVPTRSVPASKKNTCAVCMESPADCVITRRCDSPRAQSSPPVTRPRCEQDTCKCGPTMCKPCLLTHYWTSTNHGSKSYAKCVCCRAEFCLKDISPVKYEDDVPASSPSVTQGSQQTSEGTSVNRKGKGKEIDVEFIDTQESEKKRSAPTSEVIPPKRAKRGGRTTSSNNMTNSTSSVSNTSSEEGDEKLTDAQGTTRTQDRYPLRSSARKK